MKTKVVIHHSGSSSLFINSTVLQQKHNEFNTRDIYFKISANKRQTQWERVIRQNEGMHIKSILLMDSHTPWMIVCCWKMPLHMPSASILHHTEQGRRGTAWEIKRKKSHWFLLRWWFSLLLLKLRLCYTEMILL